jgi:hypothetical protein
MKRKIKYTYEPIGELKAVKDFLPAADQLVLKKEKVKVTSFLSTKSDEKPLPGDSKKGGEGNRDDVRG